jgi:hypothetical protein
VRLRRRTRTLQPLDEAAAYARCHGARGLDILRIDPLPPPPPPEPKPAVTGESLRRAFEERLRSRST